MSDGPGPGETAPSRSEAAHPPHPAAAPEQTGPHHAPRAGGGFPDVPGYEVLEELGRGGMGVVYLARQTGLDRLVALKVVLAGAHAGADDLARFRREAEAVARLQHPNVVAIYEVGHQGGVPYFAMELCNGGSLARRLAGRPLAPRRGAELVETLAGAVQAAHEARVVHRDLKPANVLLAEDGTPKVTDFGLAKKLEGSTELTATGSVMGTPSYMAPEQASGDGKRVGPAADVYALGAVLYECLTGRPPFRADTAVDTLMQVLSDPAVPPSRLRPGIPAELEAICLRCLEKRPARRFGSAAELAEALRRFLDGQPVVVRPGGAGPRRRSRNFRKVTWLRVRKSFLVLAVLGVVAGLWLVFLRHGGTHLPPVAMVFVGLAMLAVVAVCTLVMYGLAGAVSRLAFSPDGDTLASVAGDDVLKLWDVPGERLRALLEGPGALSTTAHALRALAFTADGGTLITLDRRGGGQLWDVADGRQTGGFQLPIPAVRAAAFGPGGQTLATVRSASFGVFHLTGTLTLWDVRLAGEVAVSERATVPVTDARAVEFVADGRTLAVGTRAGLVLWEVVADGLRQRPLPDLGGQKPCVLSPDGRLVAALLQEPGDKRSGNRRYRVTVWDVATDRACGVFKRQAAYPSANRTGLAFAPDGQVLAVDGALYDPRTGRRLGEIPGAGAATALAFSPDGRTVAVGGALGGVSWHDVAAVRRAGRARPTADGPKEALPPGPGAELPERASPEPAAPAAVEPEPAADVLPDVPTVPPASAGPATQPEQVRVRLPASPVAPPADLRPAAFPEIPGYEILGELGRGGMGVVYKALQAGLGRPVALKVVLAGAHAGPDELARFRREGEALARLHHPNVVEVYEAGEHAGLPYLAMEFCPGGSLAARLTGRPLPPGEAAALVAQLARGVHAAHQAGVIHRDLKPGNVLFAADGAPRVTDFGLARKVDGGTALTASGAVVGTPSYMAPEQADGRAREVGPAADVYALGAVLYECLTGRPPFQAATPLDTILQVLADPPVPPSRLWPRIPPALEAVCLQCLEKDPRRRPRSAAALADDLERALEGTPSPPARRPPRRLLPRLVDRQVRRRLTPVALLLLAVAAPCLVLSRAVPERTPRAEFPAAALARLSPDGGRLLLADGQAASLHDTYTGEQLAAYQAPGGFTAAAFSADGGTLALGEGDGETELWDLKTAKRQARFRAHDGPLGGLVFTPDGAVVAGMAESGALRFEAVRRWEPGRPGPVLAKPGWLSPDGRLLVEKTEEGLKLWDTAAGLLRATLPVVAAKGLVFAFSPDGGTLATSVPSEEPRLWDTGTGKERCRLRGPPPSVPRLLFSPDGRLLLVNGTLFDADTGRKRAELPNLTQYNVLAFTPEGRSLIARRLRTTFNPNPGSITLCLLDPFTGTEQATVYHGRKPAPDSTSKGLPEPITTADRYAKEFGFLTVSADGRTLVTGHWPQDGRSPPGGRLRVWNWEAYWRGRPIIAVLGRVGWLALIVGAGLSLACAAAWLPAAVAWVRALPRVRRRVLALAFRPDGRALAAGRADGSVRLWELETEEMRVLAGARDPKAAARPAVVALAFHRGEDGDEVAVIDRAGAVRLWRAETGQEPEPLLPAPGRVCTAAFSPDGRWLACAGGVRPLRVWLWDLSSGRPGVSLDTEARSLWALTFSPSGRAFAARTEAGLNLYRLERDGGRLREDTLAGREVHPRAVPAFTADGASLAVRLRDGSLRAWEVATGRPQGHVRGPAQGPAVVYAPDGRSAATLNADGTASLWDLGSGKEQAVLGVDEAPNVTVLAPGVEAWRREVLLGPAVRVAVFSPDGRALALADAEGGVAWCDVAEARRAAGMRAATETSANQPPAGWRGWLRARLLALLTG